MSKLKSKTPNLDELKQIILRDLEMSNDNSPTTMNLYLRQLLRLYKIREGELAKGSKEFIARIQYPNRYDDANFQKVLVCQILIWSPY
jgi:hypothetical protein